jgi:hypothetical protein
LESEYETAAAAGKLSELAVSMGRTKYFICRQAKLLGLTNQKRSKPYAIGKTGISWGSAGNPPHPRGALGHKHSISTKLAISLKSKKTWATWKAFSIGEMSPERRQAKSDFQVARMVSSPASANYSRTKSGRRSDLGDIFFRSSWEANYARYLNLLIKLKIVREWQYEPETFWFEAIRRGVRTYKPDFRVWYVGDNQPVYVEVKGWMDPKSKTKIARFRKYFPHHKLEVVAAKQYRAITQKWKSSIPTWEGK